MRSIPGRYVDHDFDLFRKIKSSEKKKFEGSTKAKKEKTHTFYIRAKHKETNTFIPQTIIFPLNKGIEKKNRKWQHFL